MVDFRGDFSGPEGDWRSSVVQAQQGVQSHCVGLANHERPLTGLRFEAEPHNRPSPPHPSPERGVLMLELLAARLEARHGLTSRAARTHAELGDRTGFHDCLFGRSAGLQAGVRFSESKTPAWRPALHPDPYSMRVLDELPNRSAAGPGIVAHVVRIDLLPF